MRKASEIYEEKKREMIATHSEQEIAIAAMDAYVAEALEEVVSSVKMINQENGEKATVIFGIEGDSWVIDENSIRNVVK